MRRALLTSKTPAFTVGETANLTPESSGGTTSLIAITQTNPAPRADTLTTAKVGIYATGKFRILTGSMSGTTLTVTAISSELTAASTGIQTFSGLTLAVNPGDFIGTWGPSSGAAGIGVRNSGTGHVWLKSGVSTLPTVGQVITPVTDAGAYPLCLQGTTGA